MSSRKAVRGLLLVLLLLLGAAPAAAQLFRWTDEDGHACAGLSPDEALAHQRESMVGEVRVLEVLDGERLRTNGDLVIRLIGVDAPSAPLAHDAEAIEAARKALAELVGESGLRLRFERRLRDAQGALRAWAETDEGVLLNAAIIATGRARHLRQAGPARLEAQLAAAEELARNEGRGLFAGEAGETRERALLRPFQGFALGLYSQQDDFDYGPLLREQKEIGARDVMLVTPWFMDHWTGTTIVPKEGRTTSLPMVARAARQARELGLEVTLMPIVLLWKPESTHWRGNIAPLDLDDWFDSYAEFIAAFADIARATEARMLLVGSEYSSLERETAHWKRIISEVRRRYAGLLSYSANWDHVHVLQFRADLDTIGMTGYHSLTKKDDPDLVELTEAWKAIRVKLEALLDDEGLPYYFSELGYASLDGINKNPWDYVSPETVDLQEQADCYQAYLEAWSDPGPLFRGAFFYTWWRNDDASDERQYTIRGKPAEKLIRARFKATSPSRER